MMNKAEKQSFNQMKFHIGFLHKALNDARLKGFADTKIIEQQKTRDLGKIFARLKDETWKSAPKPFLLEVLRIPMS